MAKQATLGYLIERLERLDPEADVYFDFVYMKPSGSVHSYRGYYDQLALGYQDSGDGIKVGALLEKLKEAVGKQFCGYKGGEYTMYEDTVVWVANHNESGGTAIMDAVDSGYKVVLKTAMID